MRRRGRGFPGQRTWNHIWRGDIHLYGHSHGSLPGTARSLDVGVDCWEHRPVRLSEIMEALDENAAREAGDAVAAAMSAAA
jgi:calcineurin-like phosphoesterase family protein